MSEQEINKLIARRITYYMNLYDKNQKDLADYMSVSQATVSNWCKGIKMPRMDKIDKICAFFNINRSDLMEDKPTESKESYYINEDAKDLAQFLYDNPDYRVLFDATRNVKREDIEFVKQMLDRFRQQ